MRAGRSDDRIVRMGGLERVLAGRAGSHARAPSRHERRGRRSARARVGRGAGRTGAPARPASASTARVLRVAFPRLTLPTTVETLDQARSRFSGGEDRAKASSMPVSTSTNRLSGRFDMGVLCSRLGGYRCFRRCCGRPCSKSRPSRPKTWAIRNGAIPRPLPPRPELSKGAPSALTSPPTGLSFVS